MSPVHQVLGTPELLDIVLRCLRDQIHQDAKAGISTDVASTNPPVKWKAGFMSLVLVNQAFFYASVGILWERMHSLDPFLSLLEA
ncbi:hypothetical protein FA13DRAFT_241667 [Coprinellus micaceus]|jgi:hypothetical protein|uniref:Uncharacterized protein n=1 Tax=Coprinellus micaceus TaxID=71717 RepID=A0A4Y7SGU9_COPMI|nr:hypothetical protein FA13DRAFT_241667 [Coprinellus micaceus]